MRVRTDTDMGLNCPEIRRDFFWIKSGNGNGLTVAI
jgi:hypothetical protein